MIPRLSARRRESGSKRFSRLGGKSLKKTTISGDVVQSAVQKTSVARDNTARTTVRNKMKLLMVPHMEYWVYFITFIIVAHSLLVITIIGFLRQEDDIWMDIAHYSFEFLFLIDTALTMLHRNISNHKNDLCTKKMPFFLVFVSWMTLIPCHEAYVYFLDGVRSPNVKNVFRGKVVLRLLQVYHFCSMIRREAGTNQFVVILAQHMIISSLFVACVSSVWRFLGCYQCDRPNWMNNLRDVIYNENLVTSQILYPFTFIGSLIVLNYGGVLKPDTFPEYIVVIVSILFAVFLKFMLLLPRLTEQFINVHQKQWLFNSRLKNIFDYIEKQDIEKELLDDIKEFYNTLWHRRRAIPKMPLCFKLLPLSLQKDVMVDIFWDAMLHSHLFRSVNTTFKRELSLIMKSEFLLPGDFIYDNDQLKSKMIYVVSGIVQILSNEDDESPMISFSGGTVINEISCMMLTRSNCKVRCATFCEIQTLSMTTLFRKLVLHRNKTNQFRNSVMTRVQDARVLNKKKSEGLELKMLNRPIIRTKTQWRALQRERAPKSISSCHTSQYLDLLVLSDEMELKVQVISLTATFPFILDPTSSFRYFCDMVCLGAVIIQCIVIPYCASFSRKMNTSLCTLCNLLDFIYLFDLALQATTAIKYKDTLITTFGGIVMNRIKHLSFQVDLVATVPYDYIHFILGIIDDHMFVLWKVPRLFKIYKVFSLIRVQERTLGRNTTLIKFFKYSVLCVISLYFSTCLSYLIACYNVECFSNSWYQRNRELSGETTDEIWPGIRSAYMMLALIEGNGSSNRYAYDHIDTAFMFVAVFLGYMLFIFAISEITSAEYWLVHEERSHRILVMSLLNFARIHKITRKLIFRVGNMLRFRWEYNRDLVKCDAMSIFYEAPQNLRKRICHSLVTKYFERFVFFQGMDETTLKRIAAASMVIAFPPNSYVTFSDRIISYMYLIKRGYCLAESTVPGDKEKNTTRLTLKAGDCFPIVEVMHEVNSFITVKALTTVETIAIPYDVMLRYIKMDEVAYNPLKRCLEIHLQDNYSVLTRAEHRMDIKVEYPTKNLGKLFMYYKPDDDDKYVGQKRTLFGFFIQTIHPSSKFFIFCETTRCILATVQFLCVIFYTNILFHRRRVVEVVNYILDISVGIDGFIKSRVYYYDQDGKYETRARMILRHYFKTVFPLDLYCAFPFYFFSFSYIISISQPLVITNIIQLMTRPFQLYRVFFGLSFLFNRYKIVSEVNAVRIKYFLIMMALVCIIANLLIIIGCEVSETEIKCSLAEWAGTEITYLDQRNMLAIYLHVAVAYLTRFSSRIYFFFSNIVFIKILVIHLVCVFVMWFIYSRLTSSGLHGEYMTSQLQNDRRNFKAFARTESMEEHIVINMLQTNEYLARDVMSYALEQAEMRFTPQLMDDFAYSLNKRALEKTRLLQYAPESLIRYLSSKLSRAFYKKDGYILRNNDVQDKIFIIKEGKVEISIANSRIAILGAGAMFGCFAKHGWVRQTVTAKAILHTEILTIGSQDLFVYISKDPKIRHKMERFVMTYPEYLESCGDPDEESNATSLNDETTWHSETMARYTQLVNWIFDQNSKYFIIFDYILNVHMAMYSSIFVMMYQLYSMYSQVPQAATIGLYMIDALFLIKLFFGFSLTYIDENSGVVIKDHKKICKRYLKKDFALDLITVLPTEFIVYFVFSTQFYRSLFMSNRIMRIFFMVKYYNHFKANNKLTHMLRWIYLVYLMIICLQFLTSLWNVVGCYKQTGCYYRVDISHRPIEYAKATTTRLSNAMAYVHVLNCLTSMSMRFISPMTNEQIWITTLILVASPFLFSMLSSGFAIIQVIDNYSLSKYNYDLHEIRTYLQDQRLSPAIFKKVCRYYALLWKVQNGEQIPALISESMSYIKQDIMVDLYSHHLSNHRLFKNTHQDFLRQLTVHFKRCIYPNNYVIVESGDIDKTMYFIHSGKVNVIERTTFEEQVLYQLGKNESFGEEQGLLGSPHRHTFVADSFVEIVMLNRTDWDFLLQFFPASHEEIVMQAKIQKLFDVDNV